MILQSGKLKKITAIKNKRRNLYYMENDFLILLQAKLDEARSKGLINSDIDKIQGQINKLKLQAEIDPNSIRDIAQQLSKAVNSSISIKDIQINQSQISKAGQQLGQTLGTDINKSLSSSLNDTKHNIDTIIKDFSKQKLNSYDLSKMFNLNRANIDSSVIQQVRNLTNELNALAKEALKTNSDSSWEGIIKKLGSLSGVLNQFGKGRDITSFKESLDILNQFQGKKIFVGSKAEVLQNTGMSVRELNNQFRNLGITFTTVAKNATHLDTIWSELFQISPGLQNLDSFGDQINAIVNHLKIAKEAMYGDGGLRPLNTQEVSNVLFDWLNNLENSSKKLTILRSEQAEIEQRMAQSSTSAANTVIQNEERKQKAYQNTAQEINALNNFKQNTLPQIKNNVSNGFYTQQIEQQIEKYNRLGLELPNVKARIDDLKAAEQELGAVIGNENATLEQQMSAYQRFQSALRGANASNSIASNMYMTQGAVDGLIMKLQAFLQKHTQMTGSAKAEINGWISKLQQGGAVLKSVGNDAVTSIKRIQAEQGSLGKSTDSIFSTLKKSVPMLSYWTSATYIIMNAIRGIKSMASNVHELDDSLTNISYTMDVPGS